MCITEVGNLLRIPLAKVAAPEDLSFACIPIKKGEQIYGIGQAFEMLYLVHSGAAKTIVVDEAGNEQILSFPMRGELIGMDGIYQRKHTLRAVALSNCTVILLPFDELISVCKRHPAMETTIYHLMSHDLIKKHGMVNALSTHRTEVRVARFLLSLSERFSSLGYSSKEFRLCMTREEMASHLGMSLETVSRTIAALNRAGLITVDGRSITLNEPQRLKTLRCLPQNKKKEGAYYEPKYDHRLGNAAYPSH